MYASRRIHPSDARAHFYIRHSSMCSAMSRVRTQGHRLSTVPFSVGGERADR